MDNEIEIIKLNDLQSILNYCMILRQNSYWAFRGQRSKDWDVELHHKDFNLESIFDSFFKFKDRCKEFPQPDYLHENDNWRWLFYAQHFGLKTPLLDWTTNPLIAVYFAVENIISKFEDDQDNGAIWAIKVCKSKFLWADKIKQQPENTNEWFMIKPPPVTNRIVRQSGLFTYHPSIDKFTINTPEKEFKKIEIINTNGKNPTKRIRQELGIMNIHHASLFSEPSGVANFVNYELPDLDPKQIDKYENCPVHNTRYSQ
jgi:hypothetical protein